MANALSKITDKLKGATAPADDAVAADALNAIHEAERMAGDLQAKHERLTAALYAAERTAEILALEAVQTGNMAAHGKASADVTRLTAEREMVKAAQRANGAKLAEAKEKFARAGLGSKLRDVKRLNGQRSKHAETIAGAIATLADAAPKYLETSGRLRSVLGDVHTAGMLIEHREILEAIGRELARALPPRPLTRDPVLPGAKIELGISPASYPPLTEVVASANDYAIRIVEGQAAPPTEPDPDGLDDVLPAPAAQSADAIMAGMKPIKIQLDKSGRAK